jgi:hypothetical protein
MSSRKDGLLMVIIRSYAFQSQYSRAYLHVKFYFDPLKRLASVPPTWMQSHSFEQQRRGTRGFVRTEADPLPRVALSEIQRRVTSVGHRSMLLGDSSSAIADAYWSVDPYEVVNRRFPAVLQRQAVNVAPHWRRMRGPDPQWHLTLSQCNDRFLA